MNIIKKIVLLNIFFFFLIITYSQTSNQHYWVEFTDKNTTSFSIDHPQVYLSQRAIDRRMKQHISINQSDLPINTSYLTGISKKGAVVINQSKWLNAVVASIGQENVSAIRSLPYVKKITLLNSTKNCELPSKFETFESITNTSGTRAMDVVNATTGVAFNYGSSFNQVNQIGVDCMHSLGFTGKGLVIAQLDAGFYKVNSIAAFARIRNNHQILGTRDVVTGGISVYEDDTHGMAVLSTMAGYIDGSLIGTAPDAKFWLIRTEDAATEYIEEEVFWTIGAEFADSVGSDIINSSLGYSRFDNSSTNHTYADMDGNTTIITKAADLAASKGILVVSSAGNSAGSPWYKITAPADADSVLTVGAIDATGIIAGFSSRGLTYDGRIKPDVCAKGSNTTFASAGGGIAFGGGTSFSSPITAGAVACLWQANPTKTNMELIDVIKKSADRYISPDSIYGYGIPNYCYANDLLNGVISIDELQNMQIYPNPFINYLQISFYATKNENIIIELIDVTGKKIRSQENEMLAYSQNLFVIDESTNLSAGMYFIQVKTSDKTIVKKIIKN